MHPNPTTLRQFAGLTPVQRLSPDSTALLLIDFQREYFDGKLPLPDGAKAARNAAALAAMADACAMPVIHVHHVAASPAAAIFAPGSAGAEAIPTLVPAAHHLRVEKRLPSSFHGTDLAQRLDESGIKTLIVAGLMTHACIDATTRDALHRGYGLVVAADACASRDLPGHGSNGVIHHAAVHAATLAALADRYADVLATGAIAALCQPG